MNDQANRAKLFRELHERAYPLLLPNPWDAGTARLLASLGFEALATTSMGAANGLGRKRASAGDILFNCRAIAEATPLPVSVDLENCYADHPAQAAQMIRSAYEHGAVGASIEDASGDPRAPIYDFNLAVERVHAAVEVARSLPVSFMLTARARAVALWLLRPRRHDPPSAGFRSGRGRRPLRSRFENTSRHERGGSVSEAAG